MSKSCKVWTFFSQFSISLKTYYLRWWWHPRDYYADFILLSLPPFKFFLCRLWIQHAITRILISTTTVPNEMPINIKRPLDVFINGLPVVSVCGVVRMDNDCCGATKFCYFNPYFIIFACVRGKHFFFQSVECCFAVWRILFQRASQKSTSAKFWFEIEFMRKKNC